MSRKNPPAKWVLPAVIDPAERYCFQISVPKDVHHLAAFRGALLSLASAYNWQDDEAHTAKEVAKVWKNIYFAVMTCDGSQNPLHYSYDEDVDMGIRIDCDCKAWIPCCDGTEKQLATVDMITAPGQPGGGQPQPQPGGGQQCYEGSFHANEAWLLPTLVSAGDTVSISQMTGAGSSNGLAWFCPDGSIYFAGVCAGAGTTDPADVAPTIDHMAIIALIDGTYYRANAGQVITVPGGVTNAQVVVRANSNGLTGNSGSYSAKICVTNNQAGAWSHHLDFRLSPYGFVAYNASGVDGYASWVPGSGWKGGPSTVNDNLYTDIKNIFGAACHVTSQRMIYNIGAGSSGAGALVVWYPSQTTSSIPIAAGSYDETNAWGLGGVTAIGAFLEQAHQAGTNTYITDMYIVGTGTDPFPGAP